MIDKTHDTAATSWVRGSNEHAEFPIQNLPLGAFSVGAGKRRIGTAIGDYVLDLTGLSEAAMLPEGLAAALQSTDLNMLFALPGEQRRSLRFALFELLSEAEHEATVSPHLYPADACAMHLPCRIGDYTDFYVGIHHATNIGKQFRPDNPLLPNYKYVPIGYHGRASSVRVSGEPVVRPKGQRKPPELEAPVHGPSQRLDYELEMGVWIAGENALGTPVPIDEAPSRIAGICLLNDWSARDLQAWEYQPLGPFLSKNFHTTISPWVITAEALAPFMVRQPDRPEGDPKPLPYLWSDQDQAEGALAITLKVSLRTSAMRRAGEPAMLLSSGPATNMYWTIAQMVTHHASGGCNLMPGDLLGTGTISGPYRHSLGSLMEISGGGRQPIQLANGEQRSFLLDGDEIVMTAVAEKPGCRSIGFGVCAGTIAPSPE